MGRVEFLGKVQRSSIFTLFLSACIQGGDPWEAIAAYATPIHTETKVRGSSRKTLQPARTYKTPEQLASYSEKRSFDKTP
jgi:hypothetical protein